MTSAVTFYFIRRFILRSNALLLCLTLALSCLAAIALAQDVTLTNPDTSSNTPVPSSVDLTQSPLPSEPPLPGAFPVSNEPAPPTEGPSVDNSYPPSLDSQGITPSAVVDTNNGAVSAMPRKFQYEAHVTVRGVYDDNIEISHTNRTSDYYFAIEPAISLGYGDIDGQTGNYLRFDYDPSIFLFVDHDDANAVQHIIHLQGYHRFSRLALTLDQDIELLDGANLNTTNTGLSNVGIIDAGGRNRVNQYTTRLGATYDLTGKTFLSAGVDYSKWDYPSSLISSAYLSGNLFINYNYSPKLVIGLGGSGGYNWADSPSPDQTFEQINVRVGYQITGKISLSASGGAEFRQFENDSRGSHISPVYDLSATYQPFDGTTITLSGNARIQNSASLVGQDYMTTTINASIRQRLLGRAYLSLSTGYESAEYFSAINGVNATRTDNYYFIQPAIDLTVTRWWSVGAYYLHREDNSSTDFFSFYDNQIGVRTAFTF